MAQVNVSRPVRLVILDASSPTITDCHMIDLSPRLVSWECARSRCLLCLKFVTKGQIMHGESVNWTISVFSPSRANIKTTVNLMFIGSPLKSGAVFACYRESVRALSEIQSRIRHCVQLGCSPLDPHQRWRMCSGWVGYWDELSH
jgi:hypothetical protein